MIENTKGKKEKKYSSYVEELLIHEIDQYLSQNKVSNRFPQKYDQLCQVLGFPAKYITELKRGKTIPVHRLALFCKFAEIDFLLFSDEKTILDTSENPNGGDVVSGNNSINRNSGTIYQNNGNVEKLNQNSVVIEKMADTIINNNELSPKLEKDIKKLVEAVKEIKKMSIVEAERMMKEVNALVDQLDVKNKELIKIKNELLDYRLGNK